MKQKQTKQINFSGEHADAGLRRFYWLRVWYRVCVTICFFSAATNSQCSSHILLFLCSYISCHSHHIPRSLLPRLLYCISCANFSSCFVAASHLSAGRIFLRRLSMRFQHVWRETLPLQRASLRAPLTPYVHGQSRHGILETGYLQKRSTYTLSRSCPFLAVLGSKLR